MALAVVSQRVDVWAGRGERRDALDQRWHAWLGRAGYLAAPLPNHPASTQAWLDRLAPDLLVLSGGNDLLAVGGDAPERDASEQQAMAWARQHGRPLLAICRGMQHLLVQDGAELLAVDGHAGSRHRLSGDIEREVNSYHTWAVRQVPADYAVLACSDDGVVEAVRHRHRPWLGLMWHPERESVPCPDDLALLAALCRPVSLHPQETT